jgi:hypothetical protein
MHEIATMEITHEILTVLTAECSFARTVQQEECSIELLLIDFRISEEISLLQIKRNMDVRAKRKRLTSSTPNLPFHGRSSNADPFHLLPLSNKTFFLDLPKSIQTQTLLNMLKTLGAKGFILPPFLTSKDEMQWNHSFMVQK